MDGKVTRRGAIAGLGAGLAPARASSAGSPLRIAVAGGPPPEAFRLLPVVVAEGNIDGALLIGNMGNNADTALHYLKSGVPVWFDGPLACSFDEARTLMEAARQHKTAIMAATADEFLPSTKLLRHKAAALAPLSAAMVSVSATGPEAVNLMCAIFGANVARVSRIVNQAGHTTYFEYAGERPLAVVAQAMPATSCRSFLRFYGSDMVEHSEAALDTTHVALAMVEMFRTRRAPVDAETLLTKTKIHLAACRSIGFQEGRPFTVKDLKGDWRSDA